ncbi:MAG: hypothetical protein A3I61_06695 [Acidobacteria bacterium RIFCSPLOWO2_02_FULL_68_18]|nr:MAG: hypothetical protein A3I61_06695 [Acidobacteria bacterium RIFCSPLOWO2_02_FULL_68_18]OFW50339.1 MAG: hypothetical protein A3G77_07690 [Acidobacteria bacterium RIFCSPLOWO2_12_FULL_68_19]
MSDPFDSAQGKPGDSAQGKPVDSAQDKPDPVGDYLERLDHLLTTRAAEPLPPAEGTAPPGATSAEAPPAASNLVADAFVAILALEEGEPGARPVRFVTGDAEPRISDALVEELTRRIIERLAPDQVRAVVADVVSEVAERLVREEIERIRHTHA